MPPASRDRQELTAFLARAVSRARWRVILAGAAVGLIAAAALIAFGVARSSPVHVLALTAALKLAGIGVALALNRSTTDRVARHLERHTPESRNLLLTAAEILAGRIGAAPYVEERVLADASALVSRTDLRRALPARTSVICALTGAGLWGLSLLSPQGGIGAVVSATHGTPSIGSVLVGVVPPEYSGRPRQELRDPERIEVLAGSRLDMRIAADAGSVSLRTLDGTQTLTSAAGTFNATVTASQDGFLALEPQRDRDAGRRRLIGLAVSQDRPPVVKITAPGRDMVVPDGPRTLDVAMEAEDDLALKSLVLRYTKITGSGENFDFTSAEVPVTVTRTSDRVWSARLAWPLGPLGLEAGDMLVYRGAASDTRPGSPVVESDAFILEIAAPGALPSEGFAIDDRQDKYAISQQMVIVKTERLLAARKSMSSNDFQEGVLDLAAEQRQVRAEFVFMMGGELADAGVDLNSLNEEVEAEGEDDLAAGRLHNQGRLELMRAIRSMSRAAARLADGDATGALPIEKEALAYLQRAFSRNRYLLRTLSERERLDLSRRLTGVLASLGRDERPAAEAAPDPRATAARALLAELAGVAGVRPGSDRGQTALRPGSDTGQAPGTLAALAQRAIAIDPASTLLRDAAGAISAGDLERGVTTLVTFLRSSSPETATRPASAELDALAGALADALRRSKGRQ